MNYKEAKTSSSASTSASISSSFTIIGGANLKTFPAVQLIKNPFSNILPTKSAPSKLSSRPTKSPAPLTSVMKSYIERQYHP